MAIALVANIQIAGGVNGGTSSPGIDTTGATLLTVTVGYYQPGTIAVSDSKSNTWTPLTVKSAAGDSASIIFYAANPTVGSGHTFTLSGSGTYSSGQALAFSGVATTSPFDVENGATGGGATAVQPGSVTPSQNGSVIVTAVVTSATAGSYSIDSSFNINDSVGFNSGVNYGSSGAYLIQGSAAAVNPTWSYSTSGVAVESTIAVFKPGAGVTTPTDFDWGYEPQRPMRRQFMPTLQLQPEVWPFTAVATPTALGFAWEPMFPKGRRPARSAPVPDPIPPTPTLTPTQQGFAWDWLRPIARRATPAPREADPVIAPLVAQTPTQQGFAWDPIFAIRRRFQPTRQEQPEVYPRTGVATPSPLQWETPTFQWIKRKFHLFQGDPEYAPSEPPPAPTGVIRVIRATILRAGSLLRRY